MINTKYAVVIVTYNREHLLRECVGDVVKQTIAPSSIIVVNNASTDGTSDFLEKLKKQDELFDIINLQQNLGGAGGFARGIGCALEKDADCVLIIDDDAMIAEDYMEKILHARYRFPQYKALAGTVKTDGKIETFHRRNLLKAGLMTEKCREEEYMRPFFVCDIASFCGMVVDLKLIRQIGIPHAEYFIWYDDTEYSLRIHQYSRVLVVTDAELNHKTRQTVADHPRRYDWKDYYAVRNRLLMVREHGNLMDRIINFGDILIRIVFRNCFFGLIKKDGYDWKYERRLVKEALRDAKNARMGRSVKPENLSR